MKRSLLGGRLLDPSTGLDQIMDLHLEGAEVVALGRPPQGFAADETWSLQGQWVTPAFIDLSCHLREPGPSYKGTLLSETQAALAGGFTRVCARADTQPPLDSAAVVQSLQDKAQQAGACRVLPLGALTQGLQGQLLSNMAALKRVGCVAVTNMREPLQDNLVWRRGLEYAATCDLPVFFYPEDEALAQGGCAHEGAQASQLGLQGIPQTAETLALARDLLLVEQTGVIAHFSHLSCAASVEMIRTAQAQGLPVTADVALSHLLFTDACLQGYDSLYHVQPPLRSESDRLALLQALREGVVGAVSSGHLPHEAAAKMAPFAASEPGMSTLQVLLPHLLSLLQQEQLQPLQMLASLSQGPAKVLGLPVPSLQVGQQPDLVVIDPQRDWVLDEESSLSAGRNVPGWQACLQGRVERVVLDGRLAWSVDASCE